MVVRAGHFYLVPRAGNKAVVGTTAEYVGFEKSVTAEGMSSILQAAIRLVPLLSEARFCRAWAGLRPDTADHLPVLGRSGVPGLTLATGHFRNGILLAPVTAKLIAEMIVANSAPPAIEPFGASRFPRRSESIDPAEARSVAKIGDGCGFRALNPVRSR